jgi:hypothetical protein
MAAVLFAAALYNLAWGAFAVLFPGAIWGWLGMEAPRYPQFWQGIGMLVGVFGIGYFIAAFDPARHWPIVLLGLISKVLASLGAAQAFAAGSLPLAFALLSVPNDLLWCVPFALILHRAYTRALDEPGRPRIAVSEAMERAYTQDGGTLAEASFESPLLLVFVRHFGCTFCREALAELNQKRGDIERQGVRLGIVHMGPDRAAQEMFDRYGLHGVLRISDPDRLLYRAFDLRRGRLAQLLGPKVWWRGWQAGIVRGHGIGKLAGDGFQMPGVFLVHRGGVVHSFRHKSAADTLDYNVFVACALTSQERQTA